MEKSAWVKSGERVLAPPRTIHLAGTLSFSHGRRSLAASLLPFIKKSSGAFGRQQNSVKNLSFTISNYAFQSKFPSKNKWTNDTSVFYSSPNHCFRWVQWVFSISHRGLLFTDQWEPLQDLTLPLRWSTVLEKNTSITNLGEFLIFVKNCFGKIHVSWRYLLVSTGGQY